MHNSRSVFVVGLVVAVSLLVSSCTREQKADRALKKADEFYAAGDLGKAEIEYLNVRKNEYNNTNAVSRLAVIHFDQGRTLRAYDELRAAKKGDESNVEVRLRLAQAHAAFRERTNALGELQFVLEKQPDNPQAVLLKTELAAAQGPAELAELKAFLQQAEQKTGPRAVYAVASAGLFLGKQDVTNALKELNRALQIDPKFSTAHLLLSQIYGSQGDTNKAVASLKLASETAPVRSALRLRYGEYLVGSGAQEEGRKWIEAVANAAPDFIPAWNRLAYLELAKTNLDSSEKFVNRVLGREPIDYEALSMKGQIYKERKQYDRAVSHWEDVTKLFTMNYSVTNVVYTTNAAGAKVEKSSSIAQEASILHPEAYLQLAYAQTLRTNQPIEGRRLEAQTTLKRLLAVQPGNVAGIVKLAELQLAGDDPAGAIRTLAKPMEELGKPNRDPALEPLYQEGMLALGGAYEKANQWDNAVRVYQTLYQAVPKTTRESFQAGFQAGKILRTQGKRAEARKQFESLDAASPNQILVVEQLVGLDFLDGKIDVAMGRIQRLIEKYPKSGMPLLMQAQAYAGDKKMDLAERTLLKAIEVDPEFDPAFTGLIGIYAQSGRLPLAVERLEAKLKQDPQDLSSHRQLALIYDQQKEYAKALKHYEIFVAKVTNSVEMLNNLAYLYAERVNQLDKALVIGKQAHERFPTNAYVADTYGWILYRKGNLPEALRLVQQGAAGLPQGAEVQAHLGMVQYALGDEEKAQVALQRALTLSKDFTGREEAERQLKVLTLNAQSADAATIALLEKLQSDRPSDVIAAKRLASVYEGQKAFDKAAATLEKAHKAAPSNLSVAFRLAQVYATSLQKKEKAVEVIRAAKVGASSDATSAVALGRLALQLGEPKEAVVYLEAASRRMLADPEVFYLLGTAQYQLKETVAAKRALTEAMRLRLSGKMLEDARKMLGELK